jgi:FemAB-related protein (PEP-CTERM system-associated)
MLSIRTATPDDRDYWDNYVQNHQESTPYHLFSWQEAVLAAYGHKPCYLIAESDGTLVGVMPLIKLKVPLLGSKLISLPFCDLGGPLADSADIADELKSFATAKIAMKYGSIEYRENASETLQANSELDGKKVRMILTLPGNSHDLFRMFKSKLRSQINKAKKNGLTYSINIGSENKHMLNDLYQVIAENMRILGSPVHSKKWFEKVCENYQNNCIIAIVYNNTTPVAAGIVLTSGSKASIPWASTIREYNRLSPNMLLYWSFLEYCCDHGITEFDFGRSTFGEGTYKFKTQWGALPRLLDWQDSNQSVATGLTRNKRLRPILRKTAESVWCRLPLKLTILLGPKFRKFISL